MRVEWDLTGTYDEVGGPEAVRQALAEALARVPREHLRQLDEIVVRDRDPRGVALGVWRQNAHGLGIELYIAPHVAGALSTPPDVRPFVFRLYLAHTLFHEVGHHVTLHVNRRAAPTRKKARVDQTLEKWAEQYVAKRLQSLCDGWLAPGGPASTPEGQGALLAALRALQLAGQIRLMEPPGTSPTPASSETH